MGKKRTSLNAHEQQQKEPKSCFTLTILLFFPIVIALQCRMFYSLTSSSPSWDNNSRAAGPVRSDSWKVSHDDNSISNNFVIHSVLRHLRFDSDGLYETLLKRHPNPTTHDFVLEVGCFSLKQSALASLAGFSVVSFDPSPKNFERMSSTYKELPQDQRDRMTLINKAVSHESGNVLQFSTAGGTGDHVEGVKLDQRQFRKANPDRPIDSVQVETIALNDAVGDVMQQDANANLFLLKIDVQGHEANVLKGISRNNLQKIQYILLEYWVDALDQAKGVAMGTCSAVTDILQVLHDANFELYDTSLQAHPDGWYKGGPKHQQMADYYRPTSPHDHCKWFHDISQEGRDKHGYQMGFWTDLLAVNQGEFHHEEIL